MNEKAKELEKYTLETAFQNGKNRYTYLAVNGKVPYHTHEEFFEIFYMVSGKSEHMLEEKKETISTGDAFLLRPGDRHKMQPLRNGGVCYSHRDLYISIEDMKMFCRFAVPSGDLYSEIVSAPESLRFSLTYHDIRAAEAQAIRISSLPALQAEQCYRALALNLLSLCVTNASSSLYPQWLNKLLSYIHASVTRKRTLAEYVETTGYCHEHVSREFKRYTGYRLKEYIMRTKLDYAKAILSQNGESSVTQIAYDLGFSSESNFITAFRKMYGISPMQWRRAIKHGQN